MISLTKEWLRQTIAELEEERDATPGAVNEDAAMALAAMKLALASIEAEPVAWIVHARTGDQLTTDGGYVANAEGILGLHSTPLYTAPPAPESVPDGVLKSLLPDAEKSEFWFEHNGKILFEGVKFNNAVFDACRAAMLQGAEPVTTAYKLPFEQWLSQQTGTIDVECGCVMTEVFFHWLRVAYEAGNSPVTPGGWVACSERMPVDFETVLVCQDGGVIFCAEYEDGDFYPDEFPNVPKQGCEITHWMPLPAAPQQEVK
ncbi:DUF551 domain-containing protein [Enterobacter hormaechei subsp. xiangfangensis]